MKVKTNVKSGNLIDDIVTTVNGWWDNLPEWLTWPW